MAFSQSVTFTANAPATAADQNAAWDVIEAYLNGNLSLAELVGGSAGQIAVVNGSGDLAIVTLSGDATMSSAGALQIAANAVGTPEIGALPTVRVRKSLNQSISDSTATELTWDTELHDIGACHDGATPGRLIAPVAGVYGVTLSVIWGADADGRREIGIEESASASIIASSALPSALGSVPISHSCAGQVKLAAGGYVTARVYHTAGGGMNVLASDVAGMGTAKSEFAMTWVAPG